MTRPSDPARQAAEESSAVEGLDPELAGPAIRFEAGPWRGLRDLRAPSEALRRAIESHDAGGAETLKDDERSLVTRSRSPELRVVIKEVRKRGMRRRLADSVRGSPARRAFRAGRGLLERGIGAALPLAWLEQRRLGVPIRSLLVSLDLRPAPTAAEILAGGEPGRSAALRALADLLRDLHRAGAIHGDLRAQHAHLVAVGPDAFRARLLDLESLRFGGPPGDEARLDDWAQVNASIPDAHAGPALRRAAFDRYAAALPFDRGSEAAFAAMTERSLRRDHLYQGSDQGLAGSGEPRERH